MKNQIKDKEIRIVVDNVLISDKAVAEIEALSDKVKVVKQLNHQALVKADIIYTARAEFDMKKVKNLQLIQTESATISHLIGTPAAKSGIPIANAGGAFSQNVAEHAMGLMLAIMRNFREFLSMQYNKQWPESPELSHQKFWGHGLYGKNLGILGYGSIGRQIGRIASAMGMKVLAYSRTGEKKAQDKFIFPNTGDPEGLIPDKWFVENELESMLPLCDAVIMVLPLTKKTHHLIGEKELAMLSNHSFFIDVGRGGVLDLDALCIALKSGKLAGAALDVFEEEPLPKDHLLWNDEKVILSPHIGSGTQDRIDQAAAILRENVSRLLNDQPFMNVVNFKKQY